MLWSCCNMFVADNICIEVIHKTTIQKENMKVLLIGLLAFIYNPGCKDVDIMLLADYSQSINGYEKWITNAMFSFVDHVDMNNGDVQIGSIAFNTDAEITGELTAQKKKALQGIEYMSNKVGMGVTNLSDALYKAVNEFSERGEEGRRKIVIIISDGRPDNEQNVLIITEQMRAMQIEIYTILVDANGSSPAFMQEISTMYFKSDYEGLASAINNINLCL